MDWTWTIYLSPSYTHADGYARDWLLTHEALHTISPGLSKSTYLVHRGWEEGVVEGMRIVIQPEVYRRLGYVGEEWERYSAWGTQTAIMYRTWYAHLERARTLLGFDAATFYGTLFATPLSKRRWVVRSWARQRPHLAPAEARFFRELTATGSPLAQPYEY